MNQVSWIPCTERMPDVKTGYCLVTVAPARALPYVSRAYWDGQEWHGQGSFAHVTAWAEMPEVYHGEGTE